MARMGLDPDELLCHASPSRDRLDQRVRPARSLPASRLAHRSCRPRPASRGRGAGAQGGVANDVFSHGDVYTTLECLSAILATLYARADGSRERIDSRWPRPCSRSTARALAPQRWRRAQRRALVRSRRLPGDPHRRRSSHRDLGASPGKGTFELYMKAAGRVDLIDDPRFSTVDGGASSTSTRSSTCSPSGRRRSTTSTRSRPRSQSTASRWACCALSTRSATPNGPRHGARWSRSTTGREARCASRTRRGDSPVPTPACAVCPLIAASTTVRCSASCSTSPGPARPARGRRHPVEPAAPGLTPPRRWHCGGASLP